MATTQITINETAQQVASGACMLQSKNTFEYGFGLVLPTIFFTKVMATQRGETLQYSGTYGAIWVRTPTNTDDDILTIVTI